jgi:CxxC-x17-CxxC domain-containing protein
MGYRERSDFNRGPREMHKITCSDCGNEAEVPFKPTGRALGAACDSDRRCCIRFLDVFLF